MTEGAGSGDAANLAFPNEEVVSLHDRGIRNSVRGLRRAGALDAVGYPRGMRSVKPAGAFAFSRPPAPSIERLSVCRGWFAMPRTPILGVVDEPQGPTPTTRTMLLTTRPATGEWSNNRRFSSNTANPMPR
jgi:hypothetical protein